MQTKHLHTQLNKSLKEKEQTLVTKSLQRRYCMYLGFFWFAAIKLFREWQLMIKGLCGLTVERMSHYGKVKAAEAQDS